MKEIKNELIYITHEKSTGRAGHQYKDAITPLILAEMFGFTYVCTEYKSLELFNLGYGFQSRNELPENIKIIRLEGPYWYGIPYEQLVTTVADIRQQNSSQDLLIVLMNSFRVQLFQLNHWYLEGKLPENYFQRVVRLLRKQFQARNPRPQNRASDQLVVAVHIRRGDVVNSLKNRVPSSQHYAHSVDYYDAILKTLLETMPGQKMQVHVYTELLNAEDIVAYCRASPEIQLHQGGKREFGNHFSEMVYSDILVVSNSSMSQMAGYLSEGVKIYFPNDQYFNLPEEEFISFSDLDKKEIRERLGAIQAG